ncbi:MAG: hypothetical protein JWO07_860 [Candidatus Saccharibacteria bacterium]|nr:hypothetical protein [Candidatus Saccharibacteria bacterium]
MDFEKIRHSKWFDLAYRIGVGIKGLDGLAELVAGIELLVSPGVLHRILTGVVTHAQQHHGTIYHFVEVYVARLDKDLSHSGVLFLVIFLLGHGIVKLVLVYCLFRRIVWAYPYALIVLVLFMIYQVYVIILDPGSLGLWFFLVLDIVIIYLVYGEWKDLKEKVVEKVSEKKAKKVVK